MHPGKVMLCSEEAGVGICLEVYTWLKGRDKKLFHVDSTEDNWCCEWCPCLCLKDHRSCLNHIRKKAGRRWLQRLDNKKKNNKNYYNYLALRWATWVKRGEAERTYSCKRFYNTSGVFFKAHFHSFLKAQNERNKYMSSNTSAHKLETDYVS